MGIMLQFGAAESSNWTQISKQMHIPFVSQFCIYAGLTGQGNLNGLENRKICEQIHFRYQLLEKPRPHTSPSVETANKKGVSGCLTRKLGKHRNHRRCKNSSHSWASILQWTMCCQCIVRGPPSRRKTLHIIAELQFVLVIPLQIVYFLSTNKNEIFQFFMAFQTLYDKLAEECDLDYIVVDLPPDHERLTMAFILSGQYIIPPPHDDFFSAASANRIHAYP